MKKLTALIALFLGLTIVGCSTATVNTTSSTKLGANEEAVDQIETTAQNEQNEINNEQNEVASLSPENQGVEMQYVEPQPYAPYPNTQPQARMGGAYGANGKSARGRDNFVSIDGSTYPNNQAMTEDGMQIDSLAQNTVNSPYSATDEEANANSDEPLKMAQAAGFKNIYFDFDKFDIKADMMANINEAASIMKNNNYNIRIGGNTDEWGTDEYNYALGLRRSNSVKDALIAKGVQADRILSVSYGESRPSCTDSNSQCWAQNRRATFEILR